MRIVTAPTRQTLETLGLSPESGLGESISNGSRRSSMLARHLNLWVLARTGGTGDRPWLANLPGFSGYPLAEFRERLRRFDRALEAAGADEPDAFGWEFFLSANIWISSRNVTEIHVLHAGFEEECRRLTEETGLPARLAEPLLRSWLSSLFRCSTPKCPVVLLSLHEPESEPAGPEALLARVSQAETLDESEMNFADPLPRGTWRLRKGSWDIAATAEDFEVADSLRRLGDSSPDQDENPAFALGRDRVQRRTQLSVQTFRDARTLELRGLARVKKEQAKNSADSGSGGHSNRRKLGGRRPSIQLGRYFSDLLKRIFSRNPSS